MTVKLLTEQHLEFLNLTGGCIGSSESTLVKMPHRWKSHVTAHIKVNHTVIKFYITRTHKVTLHISYVDGNMCNFLQK